MAFRLAQWLSKKFKIKLFHSMNIFIFIKEPAFLILKTPFHREPHVYWRNADKRLPRLHTPVQKRPVQHGMPAICSPYGFSCKPFHSSTPPAVPPSAPSSAGCHQLLLHPPRLQPRWVCQSLCPPGFANRGSATTSPDEHDTAVCPV